MSSVRGREITAVTKNSKVAIVLPSEQQYQMVATVLNKIGFKHYVRFGNANEAYDVVSRQQFDFVIVAIDLPDNPGITLLQRLKACGNYGFEPFLFMGTKIEPNNLSLFLEYDVDYVVLEPLNLVKLEDKIKFVIKSENNISEDLQKYRDAKSAYIGEIYDMAIELLKDIQEKEAFKEQSSILLGDICVKKGELEKAISYFQCCSNNPDSKSQVAASHRLAKVYMQMNDFERSKQILDGLLEANPHHIKLLENAGLSNYELGHSDLAKKQMQSLSKIDRTNKTSGEVQTKIAIKDGDFDGLAERLTASHSEKEIVSMLNLAGVKLSKGEDYVGAIKIYRECLKVVRTKEYKGKVLYNLGLGYSQLEKWQAAADSLRQAVHFCPELTKAQNLLEKVSRRL